MKTLLLSVSFLVAGFAVSAQTLLDENFDNMTLPTGWMNIDQDTLPTANGGPADWIFEAWGCVDGLCGVDSAEIVAKSQSWLEGFAPGNKNWLITSSLMIPSTGFSLTWASAPSQVGLYQDGYKVLISTTGAGLADFTDTVAIFAQNIGDVDSTFSEGTMHTAMTTNPDTTVNGFDIGDFQDWSYNLDSYSGMTIYIAFLHDSDDDNYMGLNDVMVSSGAAGVNKFEIIKSVSIYPNPAAEQFTLALELEEASSVTSYLVDVNGKVSAYNNHGIVTNLNHNVQVGELAAGTYYMNVVVNGTTYVRNVSVIK